VNKNLRFLSQSQDMASSSISERQNAGIDMCRASDKENREDHRKTLKYQVYCQLYINNIYKQCINYIDEYFIIIVKEEKNNHCQNRKQKEDQ
jgi:hypothetical protein